MEGGEVRKLTELEDQHWWYRERRVLLSRELAGLTPGTALDVGAAGGGNTRVLVAQGWRAAALEYGEDGAAVCAERGVPVLRADATRLPVAPGSLDLVVAFDILEHLGDDRAAMAGIVRALKPGGTFLVSVPADPRLWSAHDVAVGHVRRYTRPELRELLLAAGLELEELRSWLVLLRPAVAMRRRTSEGSDLERIPGWLNEILFTLTALERWLPLGRLPGVSLLARCRKPVAAEPVTAEPATAEPVTAEPARGAPVAVPVPVGDHGGRSVDLRQEPVTVPFLTESATRDGAAPAGSFRES